MKSSSPAAAAARGDDWTGAADDRPAQKERTGNERAGIDHRGRLKVILQQLTLQHNFEQHMLRKQTESVRTSTCSSLAQGQARLRERAVQRAHERAAHRRYPRRQR